MAFSPQSRIVRIGLALSLASAGGVVLAQADKPDKSGSDATAAASDSSGSFEVSGIDVDVSGKDADSARLGGWRLAQRKGWAMLAQRLAGHGSTLSDSALDAMVTGIVVENEQIGPNRYIARLGVMYDRGRAGSILGIAGQVMRSPPMLLVPIQWSGGVGTAFERENAWGSAWGRFRTGNSSIDYVRPSGTGPDALLLNAGQIQRRGRGWWRTVLDQYGASDVLIPQVQLQRQYPGGPIIGVFTASHGPDNQRIARFTLRVDNGTALDALLDAGIRRIDEAYQGALRSGVLRPDPLLSFVPPSTVAPVEAKPEEEAIVANPLDAAVVESAAVSVQFDTPSVAAVTAGEAALRGVPGVRTATTTSLALGGVSVMRVAYDGGIASLRSALEARGWQVQEGAGTLRISRRAGAAPTATPSEATPGQ
jgi:hypothetical protein